MVIIIDRCWSDNDSLVKRPHELKFESVSIDDSTNLFRRLKYKFAENKKENNFCL